MEFLEEQLREERRETKRQKKELKKEIEETKESIKEQQSQNESEKDQLDGFRKELEEKRERLQIKTRVSTGGNQRRWQTYPVARKDKNWASKIIYLYLRLNSKNLTRALSISKWITNLWYIDIGVLVITKKNTQGQDDSSLSHFVEWSKQEHKA